jgi:hypothetical protein
MVGQSSPGQVPRTLGILMHCARQTVAPPSESSLSGPKPQNQQISSFRKYYNDTLQRKDCEHCTSAKIGHGFTRINTDESGKNP